MAFNSILGLGQLGGFFLGGSSSEDSGIIEEGLGNTLSLGHSITSHRIIRISLGHTLDLENEAGKAPILESIDNELDLTHGITYLRRIVRDLDHTLDLAQGESLDRPIQHISLETPLNLIQDATILRSHTFELSASNELELHNQVGRMHRHTLENELDLSVETHSLHPTHNTLSFGQDISFVRTKLLENNLDLTHGVSYQITAHRSASNQLGLKHSIGYRLITRGLACNYAPQIGSGTDGITPPSSTPPTLGNATLTLYFPVESPTYTVELVNPEFGNSEQFGFTRIYRESRGGTLQVYADPQWPKFHTLSMELTFLSKEKADALLEFLDASLGQEIKLKDYENREWTGIITNPDSQISQSGRWNRSATIQFEGELVA